GAARLRQYIDHLSTSSNDPLTDLEREFAFLADDAELSWHLALDQLKSAQRFRLLTFAESERRLDELLHAKISEPSKPMKTVGLEEFTQCKPSASEKMALDQLRRELLLFVPQANPVLRPIAREYEAIVVLLVRGKRLGMAKRLSRLDATRQRLASRMREIYDYIKMF